MFISKSTHPVLWEWKSNLSPVEALCGFFVNTERYNEFRKEADSLLPHLRPDQRDAWAAHAAKTHPGFHGEPTAQLAKEKHRPVDKTHTRLLVAVLFLLLVLIGLAIAARAYAATSAGQGIPPTVVPLDDAAKVRILSLLRQQDKLLIQKRDHQLQINELDKQIQKYQDEINQAAQDLAKEHSIDADKLVLDLDRLAWTSKEPPK